MYVCKECRASVELAIEGELICEDCWTMGQWSEEEWAMYRELLWFKTHCLVCEEQFSSTTIERYGGYCQPCYALMQEQFGHLQ
jgi:hypothetical protein